MIFLIKTFFTDWFSNIQDTLKKKGKQVPSKVSKPARKSDGRVPSACLLCIKNRNPTHTLYSDSNSAVDRHLTRQHKNNPISVKEFKSKQIFPIKSEIIRKALIEFRTQSTPEEVNVAISEPLDSPPASPALQPPSAPPSSPVPGTSATTSLNPFHSSPPSESISTSSATTSITTIANSTPGPFSSSLSPVSNLALSSPPSTPFNVEAPVVVEAQSPMSVSESDDISPATTRAVAESATDSATARVPANTRQLNMDSFLKPNDEPHFKNDFEELCYNVRYIKEKIDSKVL